MLLSTLVAAGRLLKAVWNVLFARKYEFDEESGLFLDAPSIVVDWRTLP